MRRTTFQLILALTTFAFLTAGCGGGGGSDDPEDTGVVDKDTTGGDDTASPEDDMASPDLSGEDIAAEEMTEADVDLPEGAVVKGRVVDSEEDVIPIPFLVLCGFVEGKEVCNNLKGEEDGTFAYVGLKTGYSHLQIMAFQAEMVTGLPYAGANIVVDVANEDDVIDLGDIRIPIVTDLAELSSAAGGTIGFHGVEVEIAPDALLFPSGEDLGQVGIEDVPPGDTPFSSGGLFKAFAFYPFASFLFPEGTLRIDLAEVDWDGDAPSSVTLLFNSMDDGGLTPHDFTFENGVITTPVTDLTWFGLGDCGSFEVDADHCVTP
jgi:hypothetical protein